MLVRGSKRILCDNCLHAFVLEAAGASGGGSSGPEQDIREVVRLMSAVATRVDPGKPRRGIKLVTLTTDRSQMKDSTRQYEVDSVKHGAPRGASEGSTR